MNISIQALKRYGNLQKQRLVDIVDPSLRFVRELQFSDRPVYQVERNNQKSVLKVFDKNTSFSKTHLQREASLLKTLEDVESITHLVHDYGTVFYQNTAISSLSFTAILKEYAEGESLQDLRQEDFTACLQYQVANLITEFHNRGIFDFDIKRTNFIVSPDFDKITLIDLGKYFLEKELPPEEIKLKRSIDYRNFERMLNPNVY
ncbi:MAG: hypothetical protein ABIF40_02205 [archaeon]